MRCWNNIRPGSWAANSATYSQHPRGAKRSTSSPAYRRALGSRRPTALGSKKVTPQPPAALRDLQREESMIEAGHGTAARPWQTHQRGERRSDLRTAGARGRARAAAGAEQHQQWQAARERRMVESSSDQESAGAVGEEVGWA